MRCTRYLGLTLALLGGAVTAQAQTRISKRIESTLQQDLARKERQTTMGMVDAYDKATKAYAVEIGRVFRKLESTLPANQREAMVNGQLAWQDYLKTQRLFVSYVYDADGTIHKPMAMLLLKETLQHRLEELCGYFMRTQDELDETVPVGADWCKEKHEDLGLDDALVAASQAAKPLGLSPKRP